MMFKHREKRDAFDFGSIVSELILIAIMFLRMLEMGELTVPL